MKKKKQNRAVLLKGEGINQHVLEGDFKINPTSEAIECKKECMLMHEDPSGSHAEHFTLKVEKGVWVMGKQVEFNPFDESISAVWD